MPRRKAFPVCKDQLPKRGESFLPIEKKEREGGRILIVLESMGNSTPHLHRREERGEKFVRSIKRGKKSLGRELLGGAGAHLQRERRDPKDEKKEGPSPFTKKKKKKVAGEDWSA